MKQFKLIEIKMTILEACIFQSIILPWENSNALGVWNEMPLFVLHR